MPKGHAIMGSMQAQVVRTSGSRAKGVSVLYVTGLTSNPSREYTIKKIGKKEADVTPTDMDNYLAELALKLNVDPSTIVFSCFEKIEDVYF